MWCPCATFCLSRLSRIPENCLQFPSSHFAAVSSWGCFSCTLHPHRPFMYIAQIGTAGLEPASQARRQTPCSSAKALPLSYVPKVPVSPGCHPHALMDKKLYGDPLLSFCENGTHHILNMQRIFRPRQADNVPQ